MPEHLSSAEPIGLFDQPPEAPAPEAPPKRRHRRRNILLSLLGAFLIMVLVVTVGGWLYVRSVENSISRVDAFSDIPQQSRPEKVVTDAQNILILGSDSRDPENTSGSRTDTIILAHLPKDRSSAQLVSIPRDTLVHIPRSKDGKHGNVNEKINAAYAWGGIPLVVQTVEAFTGVRIDHVALVDFAGFKEIIDALGGVDINVDQNFTSRYGFEGPRTFKKGPQHMDGATALDYTHERHAFADGDFARIRHQQQMIKAVLDKAASAGLLTDPSALNSFLRATARAVSVDNTMSIVDTALELRGLRSGNLTFFTSPSSGTGTVSGESVVFANTAKAKTLYSAIRRDDVAQILSNAS